MRKSRKIMAVLTAAIMAGMLTACAGTSETAETTVAENTKAEIAAVQTEPTAEEDAVNASGITSIVVGSGFSYYPFAYMDGEEMAGFEVDVWNEIGSRSGLTVEFKQAAFAGLFGLLDKGEIDTVANQISTNPEREEKYYFSIPYCYNPLKLVVSAGNPENIQTLDDLVGKTVVGSVGGNELELLQEHFANGEAEIMAIQGDNLQPVLMGKADAAVQGVAATAATIKDNNLALEIVGESLLDEEDCYPFAKTERGAALKEMVDAAIQEMRDDGTMTELSEKWFGYDISIPE